MLLRLLPLAPLALASPVLAQSPLPAAEPSEIVVQGHRYRDEDVREFIDALTEAGGGDQISKFDWAVCPAAVGLSEPHRRAIAARMRQVAAAAGIPVAGGNCRPNALVIATRDKQQLIEAMSRKYPAYFRDAHGQRTRPPRQPGPVTVWHVEGLLDANGIPAGRDFDSKHFIVESMDSSRLIAASRPHFVAGILVVELNALAGLTNTQLADYAAMRLFARTDPSRLKKGAAPTILHAIDAPMGSAVPITLTNWDLAYLKALYSTGRNQIAHRQRHEMQKKLRKELEGVRGRPER
ncbi:MAG TPA: hypothetical protein VFU20_06130 [Sphingomicrobium sp.]|nr:hypothetical protein [Sphingomicrobium sp.]